MASAKPGSPHPTRKGLVKGLNGRYVAKSTYNRQVKAKNQSPKTPTAKARTKGGAIKKVESTRDALNRTRRARIKQTKAGVGSQGSSQKKLSPARRQPTPQGKPSARRAVAAAKQVRAAQGTKGDGVRTGQPKGAANRYYGADRVEKAVRRAQRSTAVRTGAKFLKGAGRLLAGRDDGSGSALLAAKMTSDAIDSVRGSTAKERNAGKAKPKAKPKTKPQVLSRNRRGRPTAFAEPKKPTLKTPSYKARPVKGPGESKKVVTPKVTTKQTPKVTTKQTPKVTTKQTPKVTTKQTPKVTTKQTPKVKPTGAAPKTKPTTSGKSAIHTYKAHGSATHVGRYKTLKEHRAAVKAKTKPTQKTKVAKPKLPKMSGMVPSLRNYG